MDRLATYIVPTLLSPCIGSFAGVLIRRLPCGGRVGWSRSCCETCGTRLSPLELVPLVSFVALRGRCRHCCAPIARFHPAVELAALAVPLSLWAVGLSAPAWVWSGCVLGWTLLTLAWIDLDALMLPDVLTLPLLVGGLAQAAWLTSDRLVDHTIAAMAGYTGFRAIGWIYRSLRGREGLGQGDAKLYGAGGAWLGLSALSTVLLLAGVLGLLVAAGLACRGRLTLATRVPFGPPLAAGIWVAWLASAN